MKVGVRRGTQAVIVMRDAATPEAPRGMQGVHGRQDAGGAGGGGARMREAGFALNAHLAGDVHGPRAGAAGEAVS